MTENRTNRLLALALAAVLSVPALAVERTVSVPTVGVGMTLPSSALSSINAGASIGAQLPNVVVPNLGAINEAIAPQLQAIAQPNVGVEAAQGSGENVQTILQGGKAQQTVPSAVMANAGEGGGSGLSASNASAQTPSAPGVPSAPAPQPSAPKAVNSRPAYTMRRAVLSAISTLWGMNFSMPPVGPKLAKSVLKEASGKRVLFSDIDDTLGDYNKVGAVLSPEMAQSIVNLRKRRKLFVAITDRGDFPNPKSSQKGAVESFATIPADQREGIILATNGGGKVYEYDAAGEPKLIFEEPPIGEDIRAKIKESAEVVKGKLAELGAALQPHDPVDPSKPYSPEFHNPYGYGMILKAGTPEASVKAVAAAMQAEMAARGLEFEVEGRMAKDATLPPYITFSKINKTVAVRNVAKLKGIEFDEAVAIGDSMYKPVDAPKGKHAAEMRKVGEKLSGGKMPLTGNATDANMEKGLPGMLTLSVGGTANPTMANGYVLPGKGPSVSKQVIDAVASAPAKGSSHKKMDELAHAVMVLMMVGAGVGGWFAFYRILLQTMNAASGYIGTGVDTWPL